MASENVVAIMDIRKNFEIPADQTPERFHEISRFAHEIFDDPIPLKDAHQFADMVRINWLKTQKFNEDLSRLRVCLLVEARRGRFIWGYPGVDDMEYMDALYAHIQRLMA